MAIKQSFGWWCFENRGIDDKALLQGAAKIGFQSVELIGSERFDMAQDCGLTIASHNGFQSLTDGLNNPALHDALEHEILANLELAVNYQIPNLIVFSGSRRDGLSDAEGVENTARGLRRVAQAAEQAGVTLILELLNSKIDHPEYQCDHTNWGVQVCDLVASPRVKLLYDIYHMQIMEGDLIRTIQNSHSYFAHYHTAGNPGRNDLDADQEIQYPPVFRAISNTGYAEYIGHEFRPKGDPLAALKTAFDLCEEFCS